MIYKSHIAVKYSFLSILYFSIRIFYGNDKIYRIDRMTCRLTSSFQHRRERRNEAKRKQG